LTLWPRSLFGRLALLLLLVTLISQATAIFLFRQDRAALLSRQFGDTKIVQLKALRAGLAAADPGSTSAALARFGDAYQARIVPDEERRFVGGPPQNPLLVELLARLKAELGPETDLRIQPRLQLLWIKLQAGDHAYWAGFQLPPRPVDETQSRALEWSLIALAVLLAAAYFFARYLSRPLRQLNDAVANVGEGKLPPPLPDTGPSEIASLNRAFNQMLANLHRAEEDRALLLAGVSHDLRTPLARLRLGIEVGAQDESTREGMIDDIVEMDKIIGQFLEFARDNRDAPLEKRDLNEIVASAVERYQKAGNDVRFDRGEIPLLQLRSTSVSRLIANLIDNALRYGAPPVDVVTRMDGGSAILDVFDRGPGIAPGEVERLKRPFTRGEPARSGGAGAGLGLAIVERIARLHGATFELLPRDGGGTCARVAFGRQAPAGSVQKPAR
jgi:two-component system, OmpR family, osmolarity sensor histidine kinase EnvZ